MQRETNLRRVVERTEPFDMIVVGGGATGVGVAVDAATRGYDVLLLEQDDLGKGTSSRSTKLVHGGVRYLQQGNLSLVMEALEERGLLRANAPHLVHDLAFVVPNYDWWEAPFYGMGMKVYDLLAGRHGFGRSRLLSRREVLERIPTLEEDGLRGGVLYYDGQFDDARLLIHLARTADDHGAIVLNYARVTGLIKGDEGYVEGVHFRDREAGEDHTATARTIVNATGPWSDELRRVDDPSVGSMIAPSQGVHVVLDASFLPGDTAIMVPRTSDKRVMFAIPWHGRAVVGTTDTALEDTPLEPVAFDEEIELILETAAPYLRRDPGREDILSVFAGIRPLVRADGVNETSALSRDHVISVSASGLLTIAGGKWTTYRKMAEDAVDQAATLGLLDERPCQTRHLHLHGHDGESERHGSLAVHGADAPEIESLMEGEPGLDEVLHEKLPVVVAQVVWAAREEMARSVEDVLARRTRALLLDPRAAVEAAPRVAEILASELGRDAEWQEQQVRRFEKLARGYRVRSNVDR